jgi:hypothetical protein
VPSSASDVKGILLVMTSGERLSAKQAARKATEAAMLAAATRMLLQSPSTDIIAALKPVEIARQSQPRRTTGAFYNIWPTHLEFRRALLEHVLSMDRFRGDKATQVLLRDYIHQPEVSITDVIRVVANFNFDELKDEAGFRLQMALWTQHVNDDEVRERLKGFYRDLNAALHPLYAQFLERSGRRMRAPYDVSTFAVTLTALVEGLHLRWSVDPDAVTSDMPAPPGVDDGEPWSMFASVTYLLFVGMTEPLPR